jgi:hypothetical protein
MLRRNTHAADSLEKIKLGPKSGFLTLFAVLLDGTGSVAQKIQDRLISLIRLRTVTSAARPNGLTSGLVVWCLSPGPTEEHHTVSLTDVRRHRV